MKALVLECLLNDDINDGNIADQFLRDSVAISQVGHTVRTDPYLIICTLPDEYFEWQIKCQERRSNHQGSATFRIAKVQHVRLLHREASSPRFSTIVNMGKSVILRLCMISWRRFNVSSTESGLGLVTIPSTGEASQS
jgi:hypothetical protein